MAKTVNSNLIPAGGPNAAPVNGLKSNGHLRCATATFKATEALAAGDVIQLFELPPAVELVPALCTVHGQGAASATVTLKAGGVAFSSAIPIANAAKGVIDYAAVKSVEISSEAQMITAELGTAGMTAGNELVVNIVYKANA